MFKIQCYIIVSSILFIQTPIWGQKKINLQKCLDYAYNQNYDIKQRELRLKQSENTLWQSRQAMYPTLSGSFSQGITSGRSIDPFSNDFVQRTISSNSFGINVNLMLYNGFSLKNQILQNEYNAQADEWDIKKEKNELRNRITLAYMQVLLNQELWLSVQEQVVNIQKQIIQFKELIKEGNKAPANLVDLEAQLTTAEFETITAKNNINLAKLSLAQLIAYPDYQSLEIENISMDKNILNLTDTYLQSILIHTQTQPIVKTFELRSLSSKVGIKIAESAKYPTIMLGTGLSSGYSSAASDEFNYFKQLDINLSQNARIGVNIPIFAAGQIKGKVNNAFIVQKIAEIQLQQSKLQIKQEIEQVYLTTKASQEKLRSATRQLTAQQAAFDSANERFKEGVINLIDLNTFRVNLERSKVNFIQSKYEFYFRSIILDYYNK